MPTPDPLAAYYRSFGRFCDELVSAVAEGRQLRPLEEITGTNELQRGERTGEPAGAVGAVGTDPCPAAEEGAAPRNVAPSRPSNTVASPRPQWKPEDHATTWEGVSAHEIDGYTVAIVRCVSTGAAARHLLGLYQWDARSEDGMCELDANEAFDREDEALDDARIQIERAQDRSLDR